LADERRGGEKIKAPTSDKRKNGKAGGQVSEKKINKIE